MEQVVRPDSSVIGFHGAGPVRRTFVVVAAITRGVPHEQLKPTSLV